MDIRKIKKLIELLEESDVEELEIQEGDDSVRISRRREPAAGGHYTEVVGHCLRHMAHVIKGLVPAILRGYEQVLAISG